MIFDVLIVGAGPAGSYLGYLLASRGLGVAIIDKTEFPRNKPCGGGLSRKTLSLIDFDLGPVTHATIRGALLTYRECTVAQEIDERAGVTVVRSEFDHFLLERARAAGAEFFAGTAFVSAEQRKDRIEVQTTLGNFSTRYLVGADGVASAVRRVVFGRNVISYAPALEALVPASAAKIACLGERVLFDFGAIDRGYGWIFPKRGHLNVGVYSAFGAKHMRACLNRLISRFALEDSPPRAVVGHAIPIRNEKKIFEKGRTWLVGDAAGFAEQVYGEGIYFALKSACLAAQAFVESNGKPEIGRYTALLRQHLLRELFYSELIARAFYRFPSFSFSRLVRNVHVNRYLAGLILGTVGYRRCFYQLAASAPYWLFSKRHGYSPELQL
jgi:geranylgeranyl reductase family protein